jgi:hypothetical protein
MLIYVFIFYFVYNALSNTICYNDIACDVAYGDANGVAYGDNMMLLLMMISTIWMMMVVMVVTIVI